MTKQHWILAGLTLVLVASLIWSASYLYAEGDAVCTRVEASVQRLPGESHPCKIVHEYDGDTDATTILYEFDSDGLESAEYDTNSDGRPDEEVTCTVVGKILMPLTHTDRWLRAAVDDQLVENSGYQRVEYQRTETDRDGYVHYRGYAGDRPVSLFRIDRRDDDGRLVERNMRVGVGGREHPDRSFTYSYDENGRLERRHTHRPGESGTGRVSTFSYGCGGVDAP